VGSGKWEVGSGELRDGSLIFYDFGGVFFFKTKFFLGP
jgi:hypothetical protein